MNVYEQRIAELQKEVEILKSENDQLAEQCRRYKDELNGKKTLLTNLNGQIEAYKYCIKNLVRNNG